MLDKRKEGVLVVIYTKHITEQLKLDISKHEAEFGINAIIIKPFNKSHDRFLIIDNRIYHIGASLKDLGKKWFAFNLLKDLEPEDLIKRTE